MTLEPKSLAIGALAGVTSALLVLGAQAGGSLFLSSLSTLPILIAGLGYGSRPALLALVLGSAVIALFYPAAGLATATLSFFPAFWISNLANLARPATEIGGPKDMLAWYPFANILLQICLLAAGVTVALGVLAHYDAELVGKMVDQVAGMTAADPASPQMPAADIDQLKRLMLHLLPASAGLSAVISQFFLYYIAARIVATSKRQVRPRENMPSSLRMNRNAIFVFLGSIFLSFAGGPPGLIGMACCGAFGGGFLLAGFGSLHFRTRGKGYRLPLLVLAYMSCLFVFPALIILVLGLTDTRQAIALTSAPGADQPETHTL